MKFSKLLLNAFPFLILFLVVLLFFYPVWLEGKIPLPADFVVGTYYPWLDYKWGYEVGVPVKNPITTDVVSFIYPMQMLAVDLLKTGQLPLWNPYILAGTPLLANFQSSAFSPTNFVYLFFDKLSAWSLQIILQHILAAIFMYLLLRHWKLSRFPSVFGGIAFAFSGFNLIWSQWNGHALTAAFIPLILFFEDLCMRGGKWKYGVGISLVFLFQLISGYPQIVIYTLIAMVLLWIFYFAKNMDYLYKTVFLGVFILLGIALSAFQVLPGIELLSISQRGVEQHPAEWAFLPWIKVITFLAPDYFGNHATQNYWGPQDYTSNTGFVGVIVLIFSAVALQLIRNSREIKFLVGVLFVSLLLSFPTPISIFLWESGFLGLQAASAHRALILFNFAAVSLAAFGIQHFLLNKKTKMVQFLILPFLILGSFWLFTLLLINFLGNTKTSFEFDYFTRSIDDYRVGLRNLIFPTLIFILTLIILAFDKLAGKKRRLFAACAFSGLMILELFRFGWKFTPFSPRNIVFPTTPVLDFLVSQDKPFRTTGAGVIPVNLRMPYKIESVEGYDAVYPLYISQFIAAASSGKSGTTPLGRYAIVDDKPSKALDIVNTKFILVLKRDLNGKPSVDGEINPIYSSLGQFDVVFEDKSVVILENKKALPRAFMVYDWDISREVTTLDKYLASGFPIDKKIFLEEDSGFHPIGRVDSTAKVNYKYYGENSNNISVETKNDGFLFISDTFYPGWEAYIDGRSTKIYRANFAFRAVFVPNGKHEIAFSYKPASFFNGVKISGFSLIAITAIWFLLKKHNFKKPEE